MQVPVRLGRLGSLAHDDRVVVFRRVCGDAGRGRSAGVVGGLPGLRKHPGTGSKGAECGPYTHKDELSSRSERPRGETSGMPTSNVVAYSPDV